MKKLYLLTALHILVFTLLIFSACAGRDNQMLNGNDAHTGDNTAAADPIIVVTIPDLALEQLIRDELNLPTGEITNAEMESLVSLNRHMYTPAPEQKVIDLTGLEHAVNLKDLYMAHHQVSDISPLLGLTKLEYLKLDGNQISELSPLSKLVNLRYLDLSDNLIDDISALQVLVNLEDLNISLNRVSDISPLAGMVALEKLNLSSNLVADIWPLAGVTGIKSLDLAWNQVGNLAPLAGLTGLKYLYLQGNLVTDISPLQHLNPRSLDLSYNQFNDISVLVNMDRLNYLKLSDNLVTEIVMLNTLPELSSLTLSCNPIASTTQVEVLRKAGIDVLLAGITDTPSSTPFERDDWYTYVGGHRFDSATTKDEVQWKLGRGEFEEYFEFPHIWRSCSYSTANFSFFHQHVELIDLKDPAARGPRNIKKGDNLDDVIGKFPSQPNPVVPMEAGDFTWPFDESGYRYLRILYEDRYNSGIVYYNQNKQPVEVRYRILLYNEEPSTGTTYYLSVYLKEEIVWKIVLRTVYFIP